MLDLMLAAVQSFESKLDEIRKEADAAERDLEAITETRKQLVAIVSNLAQEHARRTSAINKYNAEVEKIAKYGRRAIELAKTPLPVERENMPAVSAAVKGKKAIYAVVNEAATDLPNIDGRACGIYFLLRDKEIVYIGQSVDCFSRVSSHARDKMKNFNRACYVPVPQKELDDIEATMIALFKPEHNSRGVTNHADESLAIFNAIPLSA